VQEEVDGKKNEEGEKKEALKHAKNKLKTLLSKFDAGILQKDSVLNQSLETLEDLLGKKKNTKSALFKVEMEISNTNMVNTYLGVENEIEKLGKIPTQEKEEYIKKRKQWISDKIDEKLKQIQEATQRIKEQIRKASKGPKDITKTLKFALCTENIGKVC
jgi:predicted RND superfamily exporter protein